MNYKIYGAWEISRRNRIINNSNEAKRLFWDDVEEDTEGLSDACGCYVFSLQNRPWYVGMASKQSFAQECFTDHKINLFNQALSQYKRATPYLYFLSRMTPAGNFSLPSKNGHKDIEFLETMLIGQGVSRNPELLNIKGTKLLRELNVPGIINSKKGQTSSHAVQELRGIFNI